MPPLRPRTAIARELPPFSSGAPTIPLPRPFRIVRGPACRLFGTPSSRGRAASLPGSALPYGPNPLPDSASASLTRRLLRQGSAPSHQGTRGAPRSWLLHALLLPTAKVVLRGAFLPAHGSAATCQRLVARPPLPDPRRRAGVRWLAPPLSGPQLKGPAPPIALRPVRRSP